MVTITNTTQLSTFSLIRTAILANSTLAVKFSAKNILEFEPNHKSSNFCGYPYILVKVPEVDTQDDNFLGDNYEIKDFDVEIILRMDYEARDNFASYASNILTQLRGSRTTFSASGYEIGMVSFDGGPEKLLIDQKMIIQGVFSLKFLGEVGVALS